MAVSREERGKVDAPGIRSRSALLRKASRPFARHRVALPPPSRGPSVAQ